MSLQTYIERFKNVKTLVIGDVMLDRFLYGSVERISPEAPVPVFKFMKEKEMLGGAGNVAANLASLGCQVTFVGMVGKDKEGEKIADILARTGCRGRIIPLDRYATTVKTRMIAANNHLLRADKEESLPALADFIPDLLKTLSDAVREADVVLLSDYAKGLFTPVTTPIVIECCRQSGKPVIVDPKGLDYVKYEGATLVKPNLKEFQQATGMTFDPKSPRFREEISAGARGLFNRVKIDHLLVTLSEYGMLHIAAKTPTEVTQIPTKAREVFDVSGAGDTSLAALGAAFGAGASMKDAMKIATLASGIVVGKLGTACVAVEELKAAIREEITPRTSWIPRKKILTKEEIPAFADSLREKGKTVGLTNGCFDLMHAGHLNAFMEAREYCDALIVGVNSDASVKRYKGPTRPIQDEKTRALLVASLEFVDGVVIFDDDTAEPLVDLVRPDVIAKEGYDLDRWPEGRKVLSYGGRAVTLQRQEGYSTSDVIAKIRETKAEP